MSFVSAVAMFAYGALGSAVIGGIASKSAASTTANAANNATQLQQNMFNTTSGYQAPYRNMGTAAGYQLSGLLGVNQQNADGSTPAGAMSTSDPSYGSLSQPFTMADYQMDPGTQFQQTYGQQALQNSQAAQTGVLSGGAMKDLMTFNQGLAGTSYQGAYDRYMANKQFTLGSLMGLTNTGQSAASNTATTGATSAAGIANTTVGAGQAQAAGTVGAANAVAGGIGGASNMYMLNSMIQNQNANNPGPLLSA